MHASGLLALGLLGALAAGVPVSPSLDRRTQNQCRRDTCLNAVLAHNKTPGYAAFHDCVSYQRTTATPRAVTVTAARDATITTTCETTRKATTGTETCTSTYTTSITETDTSYSTSYTTVATSTVSVFDDTPNLKRAAPQHEIPRYAKGACNAGHYTSACRCIDAPTETVTAPTPTRTVTKTHTVRATATRYIVRQTKTTTVVIKTETSRTTVTLPSVVETTATSTVTVRPTGPVFILYDGANPVTHAVSAQAGKAPQRVNIGSSLATRWYLGTDGSLHSVTNNGEAAGIDISVQLPFITVRDNSPEQAAAYPGLRCTLQNGFTSLGATGNFNCTAPGYSPGFGDCDGNVVFSNQPSDGGPKGMCASYSSFSMAYKIVEAAPLSPRTVEYGNRRNPRKRRPFPVVPPAVAASSSE